MALSQERTYTIDDIYALPEGQRAELIDGQMYMMAPPRTIHRRISSALHAAIYQYVKSEKGSCEVFAAPFAVFLNADDKNYVEPDISVICDKDMQSGFTASEIVKQYKYRTAGVREYWIVNPMTKTVTVYDFEDESGTNQYTFDDEISVRIYRNLVLRISGLP